MGPLAYFISFHTYASWFHGDERGSVDPQHNVYGTEFIPPNESRRLSEQDRAAEGVVLDVPRRHIVQNTILEVCAHRGWLLHALHVRTNHVHAVVTAEQTPERIMNDWKAWSTRRLVEHGLFEKGAKPWGRHGSTRYLWTQAAGLAAIDYVVHKQGADLKAGPAPYVRDGVKTEPRA